MQDSSLLFGCCPASSPRPAPAAAPPRAGSGWHRRGDVVRQPSTNEALRQSGNKGSGEGELMHLGALIQTPSQAGPASGTARVQPGHPRAVTPDLGSVPSPPALSSPQLSHLSVKAGGQDPGTPLGFPPRAPVGTARAVSHPPRAGTMLGWPRCGSPAHAPAREGSERLHSHSH